MKILTYEYQNKEQVGILTEDGKYVVPAFMYADMFLDTPGIHKPQHKLGEYMVRAAESTLNEVDAVLFVVDANEKKGAGDAFIMAKLKNIKAPVILVVNKIDKLSNKEQLFAIIESYRNS